MDFVTKFEVMKHFKVILCIFLIVKSTFGMGMLTTFNAIYGSTCSHAYASNMQVESSESNIKDCSENSEEKKKGCCNDGVCDCICCGHVFTTKYTSDIQPKQIVTAIKHFHFYNNNYYYNSVNLIWQPPRNI